MDKIISFLLFVALSTFCVGQQFGNVKCDSFLVSTNPETAVLYKGKKQAVYNKKTDQFLTKFDKINVFYFPEIDFYAIAQKKGVALKKPNPTAQQWMIEIENNQQASIALFYTDSTNQNEFYRINDTFFMDAEGESTVKATKEAMRNKTQYANLEITTKKDEVYLNVAYKPQKAARTATVEQIGKSGVWSVKANKWIIPPNYLHVFCFNSSVLALKAVNSTEKTYDIYQKKGDRILLSQTSNLTDNTSTLATIFGYEMVEKTADRNYYRVTKNAKTGLVYFDPFFESNQLITQPKFTELLPCTTDFILFSEELGCAITYQQEKSNPITAYRVAKVEKEVFKVDSIGFGKSELLFYYPNNLFLDEFMDDVPPNNDLQQVQIDNKKSPIEIPGKTYLGKEMFGIVKYNDTLLFSVNYRSEKRAQAIR